MTTNSTLVGRSSGLLIRRFVGSSPMLIGCCLITTGKLLSSCIITLLPFVDNQQRQVFAHVMSSCSVSSSLLSSISCSSSDRSSIFCNTRFTIVSSPLMFGTGRRNRTSPGGYLPKMVISHPARPRATTSYVGRSNVISYNLLIMCSDG